MVTVWGSSLHVLIVNVFYHYCGVFFTIINVPEVGGGKLSVI